MNLGRRSPPLNCLHLLQNPYFFEPPLSRFSTQSGKTERREGAKRKGVSLHILGSLAERASKSKVVVGVSGFWYTRWWPMWSIRITNGWSTACPPPSIPTRRSAPSPKLPLIRPLFDQVPLSSLSLSRRFCFRYCWVTCKTLANSSFYGLYWRSSSFANILVV